MIRTAQHSTLSIHSDLDISFPSFFPIFFCLFFKTNNYIFHTHTKSHIPSQSLLILGIYLTRLCEFSFEFGEIFFTFFGVEVDDEGIDHFSCFLSLSFSLWGREEKEEVEFGLLAEVSFGGGGGSEDGCCRKDGKVSEKKKGKR